MMLRNWKASYSLIGLNVLTFMLWNALRPETGEAGPLALYLPSHPDFGLWQYLTSMFMHSNLNHLVMNMIGLFMFGSVLERMWGARRFVVFYLLTGLGAGLIFSAVTTYEVQLAIDRLVEEGIPREAVQSALLEADPNAYLQTLNREDPNALFRGVAPKKIVTPWLRFHTPVVGASGAIYGILTAFGLLFPNAKLAFILIPVPVPAKIFIPVLLLADLFSGVTGLSLFGGGIAHFAHLGGALIGFLLMRHWRDLRAPITPWRGA